MVSSESAYYVVFDNKHACSAARRHVRVLLVPEWRRYVAFAARRRASGSDAAGPAMRRINPCARAAWLSQEAASASTGTTPAPKRMYA
jgi:hypothetical protein